MIDRADDIVTKRVIITFPNRDKKRVLKKSVVILLPQVFLIFWRHFFTWSHTTQPCWVYSDILHTSPIDFNTAVNHSLATKSDSVMWWPLLGVRKTIPSTSLIKEWPRRQRYWKFLLLKRQQWKLNVQFIVLLWNAKNTVNQLCIYRLPLTEKNKVRNNRDFRTMHPN